MPCCALLSVAWISLVFLAVMSSSSPILLLIGAIWFRTYFLVAQPTLERRLIATTDTKTVRFMVELLANKNYALRKSTPVAKEPKISAPYFQSVVVDWHQVCQHAPDKPDASSRIFTGWLMLHRACASQSTPLVSPTAWRQ